MTSKIVPRITLWRAVVAIIFAAGIYATYARFALGFARSTHLTDPQPWGLWVGLGTLCGVGLSAGGFAIAAAVYLLGFERYRPVLRTAVLVSFLGYMSVIAGMMYELGLPWRIWHPIVMWNRHSVLFEVSWCVMLYTTVLALEFSPFLLTRDKVRNNPQYLYWTCALVVMGFMANRLNVSITGLQASSGVYYVPKWTEFAATLAVVTAAVLAFRYAV